jgi:release factor glutamine methyltransferase
VNAPDPPSPSTSIDALLARLRAELSRREGLVAETIESPALEAELLLAAALGCERGRLLPRSRERVDDATAAKSLELARRRRLGEPIAYLVGAREFHGRRFLVGPGVLVPRPETELLVDSVLELAPRGLFADVGTGSGCIAVTLALGRPGELRCVALELDAAAAAVARANVRELGAEASVDVVRGDLLAPLAAEPALDGVVANLPYVEPHEWPLLPPEVQRFEPARALTPASGSAAALRGRLLEQARLRLKPGGAIALEVGAGQAGVAREQLLAAGFRDVSILDDLAGIGRVVRGLAPLTRPDGGGPGPRGTAAPSRRAR